MKEYFLPPEATTVEPLIPWSPMPGGALTANTQMMRDNGIMDKYPDLIKAMGDVVRRGGFGTSVTPVSQFYVQQALNNVLQGPWKTIAPSYGKMVLGYFGTTPVPPDPEIVKIASEQLGMEPTTRPPLELNNEDPNKGVAAAKKVLEEAGLPITDENIFITAACGEKGITFLKGEATVGVRKVQPEAAAGDAAAADGPASYDITVNNKSYSLTIDGDRATVNGKSFNVALKSAKVAAGAPTKAAGGGGAEVDVNASMPGVVLKVMAEPGDHIDAGETVVVLEAMKMEVNATAPVSGTVLDVLVAQGDQVANGQRLAIIQK
jgi:pyruvate carboxylase subunit B